MNKKLKVYARGSFLTGSASIAERWDEHMVLHEYDDPGLEYYPVWVPVLAESLGVTTNQLSRGALLMWLIDNHPGAVAAKLRHMREAFEEKIGVWESMLPRSMTNTTVDLHPGQRRLF